MENTPYPVLALLLGGAALFTWSALVARAVYHYWAERRVLMVVMYATGWLAAVGMFASAVGFSVSSGLWNPGIERETVQMWSTFFASAGRAALLMAGLYLLVGGIGTPPKE